MRLIIAGGRDYLLDLDDYDHLWEIHQHYKVTEVVSGACAGADLCGEEWAKAHNIPIKRFPAEWEKYDKAAGPIRNRQMAYYADAVALFPGDRGTESMYNAALQAGIHIFDFRYVE